MRVALQVVRVALLATVMLPTLLSGDAVEATEPTRVIDIMVSPSSIALDSNGTWVTVHADIAYRIVDR